MQKIATVDDSLSVLTYAPDEDALKAISDEGFATLVNLREEGENGQILSPGEEGEKAAAQGLQYLHFPVAPAQIGPTAARGLADRFDGLPKPVAIHCASGKRAGLVGIAALALSRGEDSAWAASKAQAAGLDVDEGALARLMAD